LQAPVAVHVDAAGPARRRAARLFRVAIALHARNHREQVVPVADRQRQLGHFLAVHHRAERGRVRGDERCDALDLDRLANRPDGQRQVEARTGADHELDGLLEALEAGGLRLHQVLARHEVHGEVRAVVGRRDRRGDAGLDVGDGDLRLRDHGIGRIADDAAQRRAIDLREGGRGEGETTKEAETTDGKGARAPDRD